MAEIDLTGKVLDDRYRIVAPLGEGGMGAVYLARDQRLERKVVVKVPHPSLLADEKFRARFALEVRSLVDLTHPHIVKVSDTGEIDGVPYVVIEFHGGGSLADRLGEEPMPPGEVLSWLPDIARALDHIHEKDVVHRDVKPGNLLFDERGNAFLSDFGISKALRQPAPGLTITGASPGSPGYIPPEAQGTEIDGRYDQFSLAAVVFRCVTGRKLKPHDPYTGVWKELSSGLPGKAADALEKALSPDPDDRFATCEEFAAAFAAGLGAPIPRGKAPPEGATIATGAGEPGPAARPRRRRVTATIAVIFLAMVVMGAAGYVYLAKRPPDVEGTGAGPVAGPYVDVATPLPVTREATAVLRGRLRNAPGGHVLVAGRRVETDEEGHFEASVALEPGDNAVEVVGVTTEGDRTGPRTLRVFLDVEPPRVEILSPTSPFLTKDARVEIRGRLTDERLHPGRVIVGEREVAVEPTGGFRVEVPLEEGRQAIQVRGADRAGNVSEPVEVVLVRDTAPPAIHVLEPEDGLLTREGRVTVRGRVEDPNLDRVLVNDSPVEHDETGAFRTAIDLAEGPNTIQVRATDRAGNEATVRVGVVLDVTSPALEILAPGPALHTEEAEITVRGNVAAGRKGTLTVAGQPVTPAADGSFEAVVPLQPGENSIRIELVDPAGNRTTKEIRIVRGQPPVTLEVLEPADGVVTRLGRVAVRVRFAGAAGARVTVNGRRLEPAGEGVCAGEIDLAEGDNRLEVVAEDPATGRRAERRVFVRRDTTRPEVGAVGLAAGAEAGTVRLEGELGESGCTVLVGDRAGTVEGRRFAVDVALPPGERRLEIRVTDAAGNEATATRTVLVGPLDVDTGEGSQLRLLDGCVVEPVDAPGEEAYRLLLGVLQGQLAGRTRILLPAGRLRAPPDGRAGFLAETTEGGAKVRSRSGTVFVSLDDWLLVELKVAQSVEVAPGRGSGRSLRFATPAGNPREVLATVLVSRELQIELRIPGDVRGEVRDVDLGKRTLVSVDEASAAGKSIVLSRIAGGRRGGLRRVGPGESVAVDHE